jgi:hypothetical protein
MNAEFGSERRSLKSSAKVMIKVIHGRSCDVEVRGYIAQPKQKAKRLEFKLSS